MNLNSTGTKFLQLSFGGIGILEVHKVQLYMF